MSDGTAPGGGDTELRGWAREGIAAEPERVRLELSLPANAPDSEVARALCVRLAEAEKLELTAERCTDPRPRRSAAPSLTADTSFLGRLRTSGERFAVAALDDVRTLVAVLRAGKLAQRRAAVKRLVQILTELRKNVPGDQIKRAVDVLGRMRDVEIAYELSDARTHLPGAIGRDAREEKEAFARTATQIERQVRDYWDGEVDGEPVMKLPGDQRALLFQRVRDLPDSVAAHLGALLEGADPSVDRETRLDLASSVRYAGDPRLTPSLAALVEGPDPELAADAARALGRIEDPRVHPALLVMYERTVMARLKVVLAGALGLAGDLRGREYVREILGASDASVTRRALEALEAVGGPEDVDLVVPYLDQGERPLRLRAVHALGRLGDVRAIDALHSLQERTNVSAIWAEVEEAETAVRARMELRGEDTVGKLTLPPRPRERGGKTEELSGPRLGPYKDFVIGLMWLLVGSFERAVARFELAASRRHGWARPLVSIALANVRRGQTAQALATFRRAIEVDRTLVEENPIAMRALATCFLRRADEVAKDGRHDIARGLLEEVAALDLRRAPSALQVEVTRRNDAARREVAP